MLFDMGHYDPYFNLSTASQIRNTEGFVLKKNQSAKYNGHPSNIHSNVLHCCYDCRHDTQYFFRYINHISIKKLR